MRHPTFGLFKVGLFKFGLFKFEHFKFGHFRIEHSKGWVFVKERPNIANRNQIFWYTLLFRVTSFYVPCYLIFCTKKSIWFYRERKKFEEENKDILPRGWSYNTLCQAYQISPSNQASPTIFDKGKTHPWEGEGERDRDTSTEFGKN